MKKIISIILTLIIGLGLFIKQTEFFLLDLNIFSWVISRNAPKIVEILLLISFFYLSIKILGLKKGLVISSVVSVFVGICITFNSPVFIDDYNKYGNPANEILQSDTNSVLINLNKEEPNFKGFFCIVSADCGHCIEAGKMINSLKNRNPDLDISILVYTTDSLTMKSYIDKAKTHRIKHYLAENEQDVMNLNLGGFPCFFYVEDKKISQRWFAEDLGLPALDWIESM